MLAIFNGSELSEKSKQTLLRPIVQIREEHPFISYGPGFEIIQRPEDTIISHGGNNGGFRAWMFYSVNTGDGFVFLSNGDRGHLMASMLNRETLELDIDVRFTFDYVQQYPSAAIDMFYTYRHEGVDRMWEKLSFLKASNALTENSLNELSEGFYRKKEPWWDFKLSDSSFRTLEEAGGPEKYKARFGVLKR